MDALGFDCSAHRRASATALSFMVGALSLLLCSTGCTGVSVVGTGGVGGGVGGGGASGGGGSGGAGLDCDDGTVADVNSSECNACVACATAGPCAAEIEACDSSEACMGFSDCLNDCSGAGDVDACIQNCVDTALPGGADLYLAAQNCPFCQECPNNCQTGGPGCDGGSGGTGGAGSMCDDGTPDVSGSVNCSTCTDCAGSGPCSDLGDACFAAPGCVEFSNCVGSCWTTFDLDDLQGCLDPCAAGIESADVNLLLDVFSCAYCDECLTNCGAASVCN